MTKVNFSEARKKAEEQGLSGGASYLKLQEGDNRIRLMSECVAHEGEYQGKPTFKWLCYVIDRKDGKIKPFFMAHTIYKQIEALQMNTDYAFDEVPMPYDVTVNAKGAGTKEVVYTVVPARQNTQLTPAELALWRGTQPIAELQKALREEAGQVEAVPASPERAEDEGPLPAELT